MASRNLESRFERMSVQDENEHGYSKSKVSAFCVCLLWECNTNDD